MIYTLYIHDKPVIWSRRIEVIDANISLAIETLVCLAIALLICWIWDTM